MPVSVPCVSYLYKHQPPPVTGGGLVSALPLPFFRPCVAVAWLAGRARRFNKRRRDFIPRGLRCPCQSINARFARFPPFWRPFGVAVVSSAGAVSLRPFRWCRCAYKVAAPRVPCFRPCSWPLVSLAAVLACWCPCVYIPVQYFPHQSQRDKIPPHGPAACLQALRPCWWC